MSTTVMNAKDSTSGPLAGPDDRVPGASTGVPAAAENSGADEHIASLRRRLDEIDQRLIELWQERAAISHEVGVTRVAAGGTRLVLARENEILTRFRDALGPDGAQLALLILRAGRGKLV